MDTNQMPSSLRLKKTKYNREDGFIAIIIIIVIGLVLLQNVFNVDIVGFFNSDTFLNFLSQAKAIIFSFWHAITKVFGSNP